jgi:hypothetical protein
MIKRHGEKALDESPHELTSLRSQATMLGRRPGAGSCRP